MKATVVVAVILLVALAGLRCYYSNPANESQFAIAVPLSVSDLRVGNEDVPLTRPRTVDHYYKLAVKPGQYTIRWKTPEGIYAADAQLKAGSSAVLITSPDRALLLDNPTPGTVKHLAVVRR